MSSVEFTLSYSFLAASGSDPVLTAALELIWLLKDSNLRTDSTGATALPIISYSNHCSGRAT